MIIECRKGKKAFSRLIFQPLQKAKNCFLLLYHCNRNRQISFRNLLANQRFAVEILEFRLSIVVISIDRVKNKSGERIGSKYDRSVLLLYCLILLFLVLWLSDSVEFLIHLEKLLLGEGDVHHSHHRGQTKHGESA